MHCMFGKCNKCWAGMCFVLGILILIKEFWLAAINWATFIGIIFVLKGILGLIKPNCPHCEEMPMEKKKR